MKNLSKTERIFVYISPIIIIVLSLGVLYLNEKYTSYRNEKLTKDYINTVTDLNKKIMDKQSKTFKNNTQENNNNQENNNQEQTNQENSQKQQEDLQQQANDNLQQANDTLQQQIQNSIPDAQN